MTSKIRMQTGDLPMFTLFRSAAGALAAFLLLTGPLQAQSFFSSIAIDPSVGVDRGSAAQVQKVERTTPFLTFDTFGSEDIGRNIAALGLAIPELMFAGDQIDIVGVIAGPSEKDEAELLAGGIGYRFSLGKPSTVGFIRADYADVTLGTSENLAIDAVGHRAGMDFGVRNVLSLTNDAKLTLSGEFGARRAYGTVLGFPAIDEDVRYIRASALYEQGVPLLFQRRFALAITQGLEDFGASPADNPLSSRPGANPGFLRASFSAEFSIPLSDRFVTNVGLVGQCSEESLPFSQRCGYGTNAYMRGFDQGYVNGDQCLGGRAELAYNIEVPTRGSDRMVFTQAYAGVDAGWIGSHANAVLPASNDKWSSGSVGIRSLRGDFIGEIAATRILDSPSGTISQSRNRIWIRAAVRF